jgi:hypothetical protein
MLIIASSNCGANMPVHQITVEEAISAHRAAVLVDEKSFRKDNVPKSKKLADRTGAAEVAAFKALASVQCRSAEDIQSKLDYILNGAVGVRETPLECLGNMEYGGWECFEAFLRSLVVPVAEGAR